MSKVLLISIIGIIFLLAIGVFAIYKISNDGIVGRLLIVEQDNEDPVYMLEIFEGQSEHIKPGNRVSLIVKQEYITQKKQPS